MKKITAIVLTLLMLMSLCAVSFAEETVEGGVTVEANEDSITGYTATFTYIDSEATNVRLMGGFQFYVENDINVYCDGFLHPEASDLSEYLYDPDEWAADLNLRHVNDTGYVADMTYDETSGAWTISLDLPCGSYLYQYEVSYDGGETYTDITDPANEPEINELGAAQTRSQFYVPYDAEKQSEYDDWTWLFPVEDESQQGTLEYVSLTATNGEETKIIVYLPAGYDPDSEESYNVLYLSHGLGGEVGDWFHQGNANNIVDNLIAEGVCDPFIIVALDNNYPGMMTEHVGWDFDVVYATVKEVIIPYMEENYNVSEDASGRAIAGDSMGGLTASALYYREPGLFGYYGCFSGAAAWGWPELEDYSEMAEVSLYLAAGFVDSATAGTYRTDNDMTVLGLAENLAENGIEFNNGEGINVVQGGHDWFTWAQILKDYIETTLWK